MVARLLSVCEAGANVIVADVEFGLSVGVCVISVGLIIRTGDWVGANVAPGVGDIPRPALADAVAEAVRVLDGLRTISVPPICADVVGGWLGATPQINAAMLEMQRSASSVVIREQPGRR